MSSRSYLSIGDVLTLLRQEFPDVTISKIRFLESQGLVNPERTPSGYRKFYEHDVERLRWVLRQQREHFLPLKVIKDRLDDDPGGTEPAGSAPAPTPGASPSPPVAVTEEAGAEEPVAEEPVAAEPVSAGSRAAGENHVEEPVLVGQRASSEAVGSAVSSAGGGTAPRAAGGPTLPGIETSFHTAPSPTGPTPATGTSGSSPNVPAAAGPSPSRPAAAERAVGSGPAEEAVATGAGATKGSAADPSSSAGGSNRPSRRAKTTPARDRGEVPAEGESPATGAADADAADAAGPTPPGAGGPGRPVPTGADGGRMSVEELSAASGLDVSVLLELQEYGLLSSTVVAGLEYFDEDGLAVATVAAEFAKFGVEPRHLRLYKNAADREAGFVEQIVLPLVRQRNPEARARAVDTVDELSRMGYQLRGALLRNALKDLLSG
jgi:DNA-binding transcriptional MerR regulator